MPVIPRNYLEARELADRARDLAYARREIAKIREAAHRSHQRNQIRQHWWQFWRSPDLPLTIPFEKAVDRRVANDPDYKGAIADNQWFIQYATMYAQGEILEELRRKEVEVTVPMSPVPEWLNTTATGLPRRNPIG